MDLHDFYSEIITTSEDYFAELAFLSKCIGETRAKLRVTDQLERVLEKVDATSPPPSLRALKKKTTCYVIHLCKKTEKFDGTTPMDVDAEEVCVAATLDPVPNITVFTESQQDIENPSEEEISTDSENDGADLDPDHRDDIDWTDWVADFTRSHKQLRETPKIMLSSPYYNMITWILMAIFIWKVTFMITDNAVSHLLALLAKIFHVMKFQSQFLAAIATVFPSSLYMARQWLGIDNNDFERYVVCPKCYKLYSDIHSLIDTANHQQRAKLCNNKLNSRGSTHKLCNAQLLQQTILKDGKQSFIPLKTYCYRPLTESLEHLLQRPSIEELCTKWRQRRVIDECLGDVYDGRIWDEFKSYQGSDYFNLDNNYGLMLNIDWFQPYKRRNNQSVGVIYLTLMNLPRELRFKRENVILLSILPAFQHEPDNLSTFIMPLIDELNLLWRATKMVTYKHPNGIPVRAVLLCIAADIPACRKLCGFYSHAAAKGCNKCYSHFTGGFGEKRDYSGFLTTSWTIRTHDSHAKHIKEIQTSKNKTARLKIEQKYGVRYTPLLQLPYYDAIRFNVIDPMHNIFLGISKTLWKIWTNSNTISNSQIYEINNKLYELKTSHGSSPIPQCISANWGTWSAFEWKVWTLSCSLYCLNNILNEDQLKCWQKFVKACHLLCKPYISKVELHMAQLLLIEFCKKVELLFGKSSITPNMHLCCHLEEVLLDYGPVYGIWLFSFERYNGIMASINTNHHGIEIQLMRKFLQQSTLCNLVYQIPSTEYEEHFSSFVNINSDPNIINDTELLSLQKMPWSQINNWSVPTSIQVPNSFKVKCLDGDEKHLLFSVYRCMYQNLDELLLCSSYRQYSSIKIGNENFKSKLISRSAKSTLCMASNQSDDTSPCEIRSFIQHTITVNDKELVHILASVSWLNQSPNMCNYLEPLSVWQIRSIDNMTFIPVQKIISRCTYVTKDDVIILTPFQRKVYA